MEFRFTVHFCVETEIGILEEKHHDSSARIDQGTPNKPERISVGDMIAFFISKHACGAKGGQEKYPLFRTDRRRNLERRCRTISSEVVKTTRPVNS